MPEKRIPARNEVPRAFSGRHERLLKRHFPRRVFREYLEDPWEMSRRFQKRNEQVQIKLGKLSDLQLALAGTHFY